MRWFLAVGAMLGVAAACSSFDSSDDGPGASVDAGASEASPDVLTADDAGGDGGVDPDGSCAGDAHFLCEDFASTQLPSPAWTTKDQGLPGAFELSTERSTSPPRSLLFTVAGDSGSSAGHAQLVKSVPPQLRKLRCAYSMYPEILTTNGSDGSLIFTMFLDGNSTSGLSRTSFVLSATKSASSAIVYNYFPDGGPTSAEGTNALGLPLDTWSRITVAIDLDARSVDVTANGASLISFGFTGAQVPSHNGGEMRFGITSASGETKFYLDDIVCDWD